MIEQADTQDRKGEGVEGKRGGKRERGGVGEVVGGGGVVPCIVGSKERERGERES